MPGLHISKMIRIRCFVLRCARMLFTPSHGNDDGSSELTVFHFSLYWALAGKGLRLAGKCCQASFADTSGNALTKNANRFCRIGLLPTNNGSSSTIEGPHPRAYTQVTSAYHNSARRRLPSCPSAPAQRCARQLWRSCPSPGTQGCFGSTRVSNSLAVQDWAADQRLSDFNFPVIRAKTMSQFGHQSG